MIRRSGASTCAAPTGWPRRCASSRDDAMLYKRLATLRIDCPIACDVDALAWRGPDRAALAALCVELGLPADGVRI